MLRLFIGTCLGILAYGATPNRDELYIPLEWISDGGFDRCTDSISLVFWTAIIIGNNKADILLNNVRAVHHGLNLEYASFLLSNLLSTIIASSFISTHATALTQSHDFNSQSNSHLSILPFSLLQFSWLQSHLFIRHHLNQARPPK